MRVINKRKTVIHKVIFKLKLLLRNSLAFHPRILKTLHHRLVIQLFR